MENNLYQVLIEGLQIGTLNIQKVALGGVSSVGFQGRHAES